ncbi:hypothetical protein H6F89_33945 [Cyanobacteria bacterium FACHB-63]|nr:hypothetical protein [Cyanobacteria bacterium FACHB-63]
MLFRDRFTQKILTRHDLTAAIEDYKLRHPELAPNDSQWLIKNTTDAMYKLVFGLTAVKLEEMLGCDRHESREVLDATSLQAITFAERLICSLITNHDMHPIQAVR